MTTKKAYLIILLSVVIGLGGSVLFIHLADRTRTKIASQKSYLTQLQNEVEIGDSISKLDSLNANFSSFDLAFHELKGRVKSVLYGEENVNFDRDGNWINPQAYISRGGNSLQFERDKFGCIVRGKTSDSAEGKLLESVEYTWSNNRLKRIVSNGYAGNYIVDFVYDGKHLLTQSSTVSSDEESKSEIVTSYTYQDFDRYGNWTKRIARSAIKTTLADGYFDEDSNRYISSDEPMMDSSEEEQTRIITYYN